MTSLTVRPSGATVRRERVGDRVFAAVEELLAEGRGYVELSVAEIAERSGVARSTFYTNFADKTDLLVRLASDRTDDIFAAAHGWVDLEPGPRSEEEGRDLLTGVCRRIVADYRANVVVLTAVLAATGYDPAARAWWHDRIGAFIDGATERLEEARRRGLVAHAVDTRMLATMSAWAIERTVSQVVATSGPEDDDALAEALARGLWLMTFGDRP